jgi:UPF0176 protein
MKKTYTVILFYKFVVIKNPEKTRIILKSLCSNLNLTGRILLAKEGINGTLEGTDKDIKKFKTALRKQSNFKGIPFKESQGTGKAFSRLQVTAKEEVVTLGKTYNVKKQTAKTVTAAQLENMYKKKKDFVVLDLRNDFEIEVGKFDNTIHPGLRNFRDLPDKLNAINNLKNKKVVAVCTGGIRCEKATCLLKEKGFKDLYQLKDGIHTYMLKYPGRHFKGTLFVFDNRMTTTVTKVKNREIIGKCHFCQKPCEDFYNDDSTRPSTKVICCAKCFKKHKNTLRLAVTA